MRDGDLVAAREMRRAMLADLVGAAGQARADRSWQGHAALLRQVRDVMREIDDLTEQIQSQADDLTEDELVSELRTAAAGMPLPHLEVFVAEYDRRTGGGRLRVIEGGG